MANYYIAPESSFDATADAIRAKTGSQATIEWTEDGFADAIEEIGEAVWTRPSGWPNLDVLDISGGNIVYCTYLADEVHGFIELTCKTSSGQYTVEIGTVSGSTFTADDTYNVSSNAACRHYFGSALGGYKVARITGNLTEIKFNNGSVNSYDGVYRYAQTQGLLELRGKALSAYLNTNNCRLIEHIYFLGTAPTNVGSIFSGCNSLVWAELPSYVTSDTTSMSNWFTSDNKLKCIDMTGWDTKNVTSLHWMFEYCYCLEELDLSGWDVKKVTDFSEVFYNCHSLTTLNISGWSTDAATTMSALFNNCAALRSVDISGFKTSSVTSFERTFSSCSVLLNVDISDWNMSSATNTYMMFNSCTSLTGSLTIPASLAVISSSTFANTRQVFEYHFKRTTPPTLANANAFNNMGDGGGNKIYVPYSADHSILEAYQTATNWSTYASYIYEEAAP